MVNLRNKSEKKTIVFLSLGIGRVNRKQLLSCTQALVLVNKWL